MNKSWKKITTNQIQTTQEYNTFLLTEEEMRRVKWWIAAAEQKKKKGKKGNGKQSIARIMLGMLLNRVAQK